MFVDEGHESRVAAVVPDEAQTMLFILEVGGFLDAVLAVDRAYDAALLASGVLHALKLAGAAPFVFTLPLGARDVVAGNRSGKVEMRVDVLPECLENVKGQHICGLPSLNCTCVSPVWQTDQHGVDQLLQSI